MMVISRETSGVLVLLSCFACCDGFSSGLAAGFSATGSVASGDVFG